MYGKNSGQPKQIKNWNTKTEIIPIQKTEFWPKPNHSAKIAYLAEMTVSAKIFILAKKRFVSAKEKYLF